MINLGKKINSFSGFFDGAVNFLFRVYADVDNSKAMDNAIASGNYNAIGLAAGTYIKLFFESEVSDVKLGQVQQKV